MPLVNSNGPKWSRPIVVTADERLAGLNPIRRLLANLFGFAFGFAKKKRS